MSRSLFFTVTKYKSTLPLSSPNQSCGKRKSNNKMVIAYGCLPIVAYLCPAQQDGSAATSVCSEGEESPGNTEHRPS